MDIEDFVNRKLTKTGEMPNGDNIYFITEKSVNAIKEQLRIGTVSSMLTVKEVLDILDDSDHLDDAKTLIRETVS